MPPALGGSAADRQRLEVFIRRSHRSRCVPPDLPAFADICLSADEELFSAVIRDIDHLLQKLLQPLSTASQSYNLRERKHNYLLPLRTSRLSDHNFIQSLLVSVLFLLSIAFPQLGAFLQQFIKEMCYA